MQDTPANPPIRDAATVVVLRRIGDEPCVLMGQRGAKAAFMPNKFVFPGGAVDAEDHNVPLGAPLLPQDHSRLSAQSTCPPNALAAAALRELWEETGQIMGTPSPPDTPWTTPPQSWADFARGGSARTPHPCVFSFAPSPRKAGPADLTHAFS